MPRTKVASSRNLMRHGWIRNWDWLFSPWLFSMSIMIKWRGSQYCCGRMGWSIQPHSYLLLPHAHSNGQKIICVINARFDTVWWNRQRSMDGPTDGPMDQRATMGKSSTRVACPQQEIAHLFLWCWWCLCTFPLSIYHLFYALFLTSLCHSHSIFLSISRQIS